MVIMVIAAIVIRGAGAGGHAAIIVIVLSCWPGQSLLSHCGIGQAHLVVVFIVLAWMVGHPGNYGGDCASTLVVIVGTVVLLVAQVVVVQTPIIIS